MRHKTGNRHTVDVGGTRVLLGLLFADANLSTAKADVNGILLSIYRLRAVVQRLSTVLVGKLANLRQSNLNAVKASLDVTDFNI